MLAPNKWSLNKRKHSITQPANAKHYRDAKEGSTCTGSDVGIAHEQLCDLTCVCFLPGKKRGVEALWRDFFSNTSQWWDHRPDKINPRFPDFKHKQTGESLWLTDTRNPPWVQAELAAILPGTLQCNVFTWAQRLKRYVNAGQYTKAMQLFHQMQEERICPDTWTFLPVLNACAGLGALEEGRRLHEQIIQVGCDADAHVATCLVDMYAKCGSVEDAWSVFKNMGEHDVVSWNAMIGGCVKSGQGLKALDLYRKMQLEAVEPDTFTFVGALNACASVIALEEGRRVHEQVIQRGLECHVYIGSCLVDMYAKCGSIEDAWSVFSKMRKHNVVSWNAMIGGYVKSGQGLKAMELFRKMQLEGVEPDVVTFVGVLNACASVADLVEGRNTHEQIIQSGCKTDVYVDNCLVDMYAKCGSIKDAWSVFSKMSEHNVVSWTAIIGGYVKAGQGLKAMELFRKMQQEGVEPNDISFVGVLNACASVAALGEGRRVHEQILQRGRQSSVYMGSSLVDMYAKCGSIEDAQKIFNKMPIRNVVAWTAMIGGYAMHGHAKEAIEVFGQMCKEGVEINQVTFICLLSACSHGRLVKEGLRYFKSMTSCFNILPTMEHYACMVDLLARDGHLLEAEDVTKRMPLESDACLWMSLLGACSIHGNIELGERAARRCWALDPENASGHVLLSNLYATSEKLDNSASTAEEGLQGKVWREPGHSWIEVGNMVHPFVEGDEEHPQILEICAVLERLSVQMNEDGYVSDTRFILSKGKELCHHSEKLAIAYGLISTLPGTPLLIKKDLRMCPECHGAIKFIAKMVGRVITVKDASRFHCFEGGICSCKDYW